MSVQITPEVEGLVRSIMSDGRYRDEAEVLSEALRLLQNRDRLRAEINDGIAELDRGERIDADTVFAELDQKASKLTPQ